MGKGCTDMTPKGVMTCRYVCVGAMRAGLERHWISYRAEDGKRSFVGRNADMIDATGTYQSRPDRHQLDNTDHKRKTGYGDVAGDMVFGVSG